MRVSRWMKLDEGLRDGKEKDKERRKLTVNTHCIASEYNRL